MIIRYLGWCFPFSVTCILRFLSVAIYISLRNMNKTHRLSASYAWLFVAKQGSAERFSFQCGTSMKCSGLYSELFPFLWTPVNLRNSADNHSHGVVLIFVPCDRHVAKKTQRFECVSSEIRLSVLLFYN